MKYIKSLEIFESGQHWTEPLFNKVKFDRVIELKELTYPFLDEFDMLSDIDFYFRKNGVYTPGYVEDYIEDSVVLYKSYIINIHSNTLTSNSKNFIDKLIKFKEYEIEILNRLKDIGYLITRYTNITNMGPMEISLHHKDDYVNKELFINYPPLV